jgi:hypothetical protein
MTGYKIKKDQFFGLMFKKTETVCVSNSKYGYHSVPLEEVFKETVALFSPNDKIALQTVSSESLTLVALNPIQGFRQDSNCTAYRNFLVEFDIGTLEAQLEHVKRLGLPYSAAIFSGNKSLHFLIALDEDLPTEEVYREYAEWVLNIIPLADQNCKNPSRSIRIPGAIRDNGNSQELIEMGVPVKLSVFTAWLQSYPGAKPKKWDRTEASGEPDCYHLPFWIRKQLRDGIDFCNGRNKTWFSFGCAFFQAGYSFDDALDSLSQYFSPDRDFKRREWETAIKSAYKHMEKKV